MPSSASLPILFFTTQVHEDADGRPIRLFPPLCKLPMTAREPPQDSIERRRSLSRRRSKDGLLKEMEEAAPVDPKKAFADIFENGTVKIPEGEPVESPHGLGSESVEDHHDSKQRQSRVALLSQIPKDLGINRSKSRHREVRRLARLIFAAGTGLDAYREISLIEMKNVTLTITLTLTLTLTMSLIL